MHTCKNLRRQKSHATSINSFKIFIIYTSILQNILVESPIKLFSHSASKKYSKAFIFSQKYFQNTIQKGTVILFVLHDTVKTRIEIQKF